MAEEQTKKPIADEIATTYKDIDIFTGWTKRLENPDPVLQTEAGGKGLKLYDEVDRDAHAGSVLQTRYLSVVGKEWEVLAGDDGEQSQNVADFVKTALENTNFTQACSELLQAVLYGYYTAEVLWHAVGGKWVPKKLMGKHPRRFIFTPDRELRLLTPSNMIEGEQVPDRKFIVFTWGDSDNPYGKGLGRKLWWNVWFKKHGIKFWMIFLEKFGMPTVVGKYPPGTPPDQQKALLDAIDAIHTESGVKIPDTMAIDLIEAARAGKVTYETLCEYMDRQMSKAVLGQTASTEGTPGKLGNEDAQDAVRDDILKADADLLCECLNGSLIKWIVDYNFANVPAYPKLWIRTKEEGDLKNLADRDEVLVNKIGLPVGKSYFYETYAIPEPEKGDEIVVPQTTQGFELEKPPVKEFSEPEIDDLSPADTLTAISEKALKNADAAAMMAPVEKLLNSVDSLDEFRDRLLEVYGEMDESSMGDLMQQSLVLADLSGRFDATER